METKQVVINPVNPDYADVCAAKNRLLFREVKNIRVVSPSGEIVLEAKKPEDFDLLLARCR